MAFRRSVSFLLKTCFHIVEDIKNIKKEFVILVYNKGSSVANRSLDTRSPSKPLSTPHKMCGTAIFSWVSCGHFTYEPTRCIRYLECAQWDTLGPEQVANMEGSCENCRLCKFCGRDPAIGILRRLPTQEQERAEKALREIPIDPENVFARQQFVQKIFFRLSYLCRLPFRGRQIYGLSDWESPRRE
jgi:hypothetical protein